MVFIFYPISSVLSVFVSVLLGAHMFDDFFLCGMCVDCVGGLGLLFFVDERGVILSSLFFLCRSNPRLICSK